MPAFSDAQCAGFTGIVGVTGTNNAGMPLQDIPHAAPEVLTTKDAFLYQVSVTNGSGGALTLTITDGNSKYAMQATSIANATTVSFNWENGIFMDGGISWQASAAGLDGSLVAVYRNV